MCFEHCVSYIVRVNDVFFHCSSDAMRQRAVVAYLVPPTALTLETFARALRREPFGTEMFVAVLLGSFFFCAAPHLLWIVVSTSAKFSNVLWHAGLIAATIAMTAIVALLFPPDPSGLPMQWLIYWPLAVILQNRFSMFHRAIQARMCAIRKMLTSRSPELRSYSGIQGMSLTMIEKRTIAPIN